MRAAMSLLLAALAMTAAGQDWVIRYNGPANDEDQARAITVDDAGNVLVTGSSWGSGTSYDIVTIKYGQSGESLWAVRFDGAASGSDEARAIALFADKVVVTGGSADASLATDAVTIAYDASGNQSWAARYNGPTSGNDHGLAIAAGDDGVYVAGYSSGDTMFWDIITARYDADGNEQWVSRFSTVDEDYAVGVVVSPDGAVYAAGNIGSPYVLNWDYVTIKYDPASGDTVWTRRYNGPADEQDETRAIAVDRDGNVIVTGGSAGPNGLDFTTIKYRPSGEELWVRRYDGPASSTDWAYGMAVDDEGNVYVTGSSLDPVSDADFATVKYLPDGTQDWVARYNGPGNGFDEARAVAVDATGSVYVAGASRGVSSRSDYALVKYDALGNELWVQRYDGPDSRDDEPMAMALDDDRGICVTGWSTSLSTGSDFATLRYLTAGIEERPAHNVLSPVTGATIVGPVLTAAVPGVLVDISGRTTMSLKAGHNDVVGLRPGVYFARLAGDRAVKLVLGD